jgi:hypothetical protein
MVTVLTILVAALFFWLYHEHLQYSVRHQELIDVMQSVRCAIYAHLDTSGIGLREKINRTIEIIKESVPSEAALHIGFEEAALVLETVRLKQEIRKRRLRDVLTPTLYRDSHVWNNTRYIKVNEKGNNVSAFDYEIVNKLLENFPPDFTKALKIEASKKYPPPNGAMDPVWVYVSLTITDRVINENLW